MSRNFVFDRQMVLPAVHTSPTLKDEMPPTSRMKELGRLPILVGTYFGKILLRVGKPMCPAVSVVVVSCQSVIYKRVLTYIYRYIPGIGTVPYYTSEILAHPGPRKNHQSCVEIRDTVQWSVRMPGSQTEK